VRERSPTDAAERRQQLSALSRVLRVRFAADGDRADLERSVALDAEALEGVPAAHPERALLLVNAAHGLARMSTNRDADWARAVELWREGCTIGVAQQPALALTAAITWLDLALQRGAAEDATDGTGLALDALEQLVASQGARQDQEQWLHLAAPLPAMAARVLVAADEPEQAVLAVERGRALLLSLLLERSGGVERPTLAQLRDLAAQGPLIYLVPGDGAMALVVEPSRVSVVPLAGLSETAVTDAVSRLYRAYYHRRDDRDGWRASFDDVTRWLWTAAMGPVLAAVPEASTVNLLPGGLLALLPLHAAWAPDAARASGRRYACDEAQIALQANAHLLLRPASAPLGRAGLLVAVADPRPTSETPLPWALAEAQAAAAAFDRSRILAHEEATPENVAELAEDAAVIHWACHGRADIEHPLSGGLVLAGDHVLSLEAVQTSRLTARLVVASACESASVAPGLPNEVVNFAAAVLQAGAEAVLATAFAVDDFTALLVCTRFYGAWRPGVRGPEALREAAAFVRDSTNAEKLAWVQELRSQGMPRTVTDAIEGVLAFAAPEQRSFAAPVEWAPFTWWGRHVVA